MPLDSIVSWQSGCFSALPTTGPGQAVTGCVGFFGIPDGTAVSSVSVLLVIPSAANSVTGEWIIP